MKNSRLIPYKKSSKRSAMLKPTLRSFEADFICAFVALICFSKFLSLPSRLLSCSLIDFSSFDTVLTHSLYKISFSLAANFASSSSCSIFFTTSPSYFPTKETKKQEPKNVSELMLDTWRGQHDDQNKLVKTRYEGDKKKLQTLWCSFCSALPWNNERSYSLSSSCFLRSTNFLWTGKSSVICNFKEKQCESWMSKLRTVKNDNERCVLK